MSTGSKSKVSETLRPLKLVFDELKSWLERYRWHQRGHRFRKSSTEAPGSPNPNLA